MKIQWFPGHMAKTRRMIENEIKNIDVVIEILDARIPMSSQNPLLAELTKSKSKVFILNKGDLADDRKTKEWLDFFNSQENVIAFSLNSLEKSEKAIKTLKEALVELTKEKRERKEKKGIKNIDIKAMITGVPNVGKSTFINSIARERVTKTGNKPGVTRGKQWINLGDSINLLDTPGMLWPKFENPHIGFVLAVTGSVKDEVVDLDDLAFHLIAFLKKEYPELLIKRYDLEKEDMDSETIDIMEKMASNRGCIQRGNKVDYTRIANILIKEFRSGTLGKISLERPSDFYGKE